MILFSNSYTTESVLMGHPDKICDQVSDAILDAYIKENKHTRAAIECLGCSDGIVIAGEVSDFNVIDIDALVTNLYCDIGYKESLKIYNLLSEQSTQLHNAVISGGAGDQGIMYGFACESKFNYLPHGTFLANMLSKKIDEFRKKSNAFMPDGKVQVSVKNGFIQKINISVQHNPETDLETLRQSLYEHVVKKVVKDLHKVEVCINRDSGFIQGGFSNDTGLTGRKIIIDTYGGLVPHGGGAFSGKDPSKVDRSGSYMARFVAKNIVANGYAKECLVAVAYEFGVAEPIMITSTTDISNNNRCILEIIKNNFDFRPQAIIERLNLRETKYLPTATYGHFTNPDYTWEKIISM